MENKSIRPNETKFNYVARVAKTDEEKIKAEKYFELKQKEKNIEIVEK